MSCYEEEEAEKRFKEEKGLKRRGGRKEIES
jgi:hypothetical protein